MKQENLLREKQKQRRISSGKSRILLGAGLIMAVCLLGGCGNSEMPEECATEQEVKISMILKVDSTTGKKDEEKLVDSFNAAYQGTYELEAEWIMETEEEYRQNLKRLNATDNLPDIMSDLRMLPSFYQMMIQDGRLEDLKPYMDADPEWQNMIEPVVLEGCTAEDGEIYLAPLSTAAFSCAGVFWNKELFAQAGIDSFPETWDAFWSCCDKLQAAGITPLALHTEGTGWAPMLLATAETASTREGMDFMQQIYPERYDNEAGIQMANTLQRLFRYTTEDALHTDFDTAYANFFRGQAAMIPNGYWMIDQIPGDWVEKVGFAPFPGNELISSPETFGWAINQNAPEDVKKGAVEFLKYRTMLNQKEKEQLFDQKSSSVNQVEADYLAAYANNPAIVPNYQVKWNSILQEETIGEHLPELAVGDITPEEYAAFENESVKKFLAEQ